MKIVVSILVGVLFAVLLSHAAFAASVTMIDWDLVTTYTGTTAPIDGPVTYSVFAGTTSGTYSISASGLASPPELLSTLMAGKADGLYFAAVTCTDVWGTMGNYSNEVRFLKRGTNFFVQSPGLVPGSPVARVK